MHLSGWANKNDSRLLVMRMTSNDIVLCSYPVLESLGKLAGTTNTLNINPCCVERSDRSP